MNLRILSVETMIVLAKFWLQHPRPAAILASHPAGVALRTQLQLVYDLLLTLNKRRHQARTNIAELTRLLIALDKRHDNAARGLYYHLQALRALASDADEDNFYHSLLIMCFPDGLAIVNRSYLDESGFAESLAEQMTPGLRARMATIPVGTHTLDDVCQQWIQAGRELGLKTLERQRLQTAHSVHGASAEAIRAMTIRSHWIQTVQGMDTSMKLMGLSPGDRETLMAPLLRSIAAAQSRASRPNGDEAGDESGEQLLDVPRDDDTSAEPDGQIDGHHDGGQESGEVHDSDGEFSDIGGAITDAERLYPAPAAPVTNLGVGCALTNCSTSRAAPRAGPAAAPRATRPPPHGP